MSDKIAPDRITRAQGGIGRNIIVTLKVDGVKWGSVQFYGHGQWGIHDALGHKLGGGVSKDAALAHAIGMLREGAFPSPDEAWENNVYRDVRRNLAQRRKDGADLLFSVAAEVIASVHVGDPMRQSPPFRRLVGVVVGSFKNALERDVALRDAYRQDAEPNDWTHGQIANCERRIAFADEIVAKMKRDLGLPEE